MRSFLSDAAYALRGLRARPWVTGTIILMLAVGIGANTAMFGVIHAALLQALPYEEPERLVLGRPTFDGRLGPNVSGYDYYDYRSECTSFESLAAIKPYTNRLTILGTGEPDRRLGTWVTYDLFQTLGARPAVGRFFAAEEAMEGRNDVIVISYGYWQDRFAGSAEVVGKRLLINGEPFAIIGVLPRGFHFVNEADIWRLTYRDGPAANARRWHNLQLVGRLRDGVTVAQAQAEVDAISQRLEELYPETNQGKGLNLTSLSEALVEGLRTNLLLLMAVVALVLLIACGNVAGLLVARAQIRSREIAVRSALGASRWRLVAQLLTESMMLSVTAGSLGVGVAFFFRALLTRLLPLGDLGITTPPMSLSVLAFAVAISLLTGVLFGTAPALHATMGSLSERLRSGVRASRSRGGSRLHGGLVVTQISISMVLLVGAGLLIQSLSRQMTVDLGFEPSNLLTATIQLPLDSYPGPEEQIQFFTSLTEEAKALPGVDSVAFINQLPIRDPGGNPWVYRADQPPTLRQETVSALYRNVLPGYFETMRIPIVAGRDIAPIDTEDAPRVVVISRRLAEIFYPSSDPVGRRLVVDLEEAVEHEIIGVVEDARLNSPRGTPYQAMYLSFYQHPRSAMRIAVRTASDPGYLVGPLRDVLRQEDRNVPLAEPATMTSVVDDSISDIRVITACLGLFSSIALTLALVGLYAVLAFYVAQRTHEIGVRIAMGATASRLVTQVLGRGSVLVLVGIVLGMGGAFFATRFLQQLLYETDTTEPVVLASVPIVLGLTALMACVPPAWRATRVNPVRLLRTE